MANFERLVRNALASQDSSSPEVRQVIYQSSRNALQKIIENNRSLTLEAVMEQKRKLEISIAEIEDEFINPQPAQAQIFEETVPEPEPQVPVFEEPVIVKNAVEETVIPDTIIPDIAEPDMGVGVEAAELAKEPANTRAIPQVAEDDPLREIQQILESTSTQPQSQQQSYSQPQPRIEPELVQSPTPQSVEAPEAQQRHEQPNLEPEIQPDVSTSNSVDESLVGIEAEERYSHNNAYEQPDNMPLGFAARRKKQKRFIWSVLIIIILALLAYIAYVVVTGIMSSSLLGQAETEGQKLNPNSISRQAEADNYITVLQAKDTSALITAGRGKAEIVRELNSDMLRVNSVRDALNRSEPAQPLLIRLKPGILEQISGKRVTVEIFAKSGASEKASYAVGCEFGNLSSCGRKRFLVGSQPEASVFAFQMDTVSDINQDMFISLSTDTTSEAAITGKGDVLDIVYIRLRADN